MTDILNCGKFILFLKNVKFYGTKNHNSINTDVKTNWYVYIIQLYTFFNLIKSLSIMM